MSMFQKYLTCTLGLSFAVSFVLSSNRDPPPDHVLSVCQVLSLVHVSLSCFLVPRTDSFACRSWGFAFVLAFAFLKGFPLDCPLPCVSPLLPFFEPFFPSLPAAIDSHVAHLAAVEAETLEHLRLSFVLSKVFSIRERVNVHGIT